MRRGAIRVLAFLVAFAVLAGAAETPNVIFILADDLGVGDLGCYGQEKIKTPNLDRMAREGMRFTEFYAGHSVSAPSRCALLTGKHTGHAVIRDNWDKGKTVEGQMGMPADTVTMAQMLKQAGYSTGFIGKWALGMPEDHSAPSDFGFDYYYGYLCQRVAHTHYPPWLWRNGAKQILKNPPFEFGKMEALPSTGDVYGHDLLAEDALRWISEQKQKPFFLCLAFTIPHISLQVPQDALKEYAGAFPETEYVRTSHYAKQATPRAAYAAMVSRMDRDIGRLFARLKELGIDEKTCVFFASDNGATFKAGGADPDFFQSNLNLRGYKEDLYEGGIRIPFLVRWAGRIRPGMASEFAGALWDVFPTVCEITGAPTPPGLDGISFVPTLAGTPFQLRHDYLYWESHDSGGRQAVRFGYWKAVRNDAKKSPDAAPELYNLDSDPGEQMNLAGEHPEIMTRALDYLRAAHAPSPVPQWNF